MTLLSQLKNKYITFLLVAAILFNVGFYIYQINDLTKDIYLTKDYQVKIQELASVNHNLSSKALEGDSWSVLEEQIAKYNFEKVDNSKYVKVIGNSVVRAE